MSLINSMLRDLESRRSDGTAAAPFQGQVRAVPAKPASTMKFKLGAAAGGVVLLAVAGVASQRLWQAPAPAAQARAQAQAQAQAVPQVASKLPEITPPVAAQASAETPAPAVKPEAVAAAKPAADADAPAVKIQETRDATVKALPAVASSLAAIPAVASSPIAMPAPAKPVAQTPAARSDASTTLAAPAALPASQTASASSQPAAAPAKRQPMPASGLPKAQPQNEETPLQPALASASPAVEPLKIVREAMPQPELAMQLARQQLQDNALREAIDTLQRTLPQAGGRADYHAFLAALLQRDDQHRAAAEHYTTALRSAPDNGVWWMGLGISCQALQMAAQAQQAYRSAQSSRTLSPELAAFVEARLSQLQRP